MNSVPGSNLFRDALTAKKFIYGAELVTTRGVSLPGSPDKILELGEAFSANPRITWVSITDNPSGLPMQPADLLGRILKSKKEVVLHLTCKDRNRGALESAGWGYASEGLNNILALSGDYPKTGYRGISTPVFDLDSVGLIGLLNEMNKGLKVPGRKGETTVLAPTDFFIGCAVSPFKMLEDELIPQYLKLQRKIAAGAKYVSLQLGYDMRKFHEIKLFLASRGLDVPVIGTVFLLTKTVAGMFHKGLFPGCVVSNELLETAEKYAAGPDKGKAFFRELAAKQLAVFRGLGFAGGYLAGLSKGETVDEIVSLSESYGENDWKNFAKEIQWSRPGEFYMFDRDPSTGLGVPGRLNPEYAESVARPRAGKYVTIGYRMSRRAHDNVFTPGRGLFGLMTKLFSWLDRKPGLLANLVYFKERVGKTALYGCRDCGDCSLPDCAYLCPMSSCSKNQRNGPCGGSHEGLCEVDLNPKACIWVKAHQRLKYYREVEKTFGAPAIYFNAGLEGTSSWANTFLGRDHNTGPIMGPGKGVKKMGIPGLTIIGESINDSIPSTNKLYSENNIEGILELARSQDAGGAGYIDVNVGRRTPEFMAEMVGKVQTVTAKPLSIDTPDVAIARAGLLAYDPAKAGGKPPILNSISPLRTKMFDIYKERKFMPILLISERVEGGQFKPNQTTEETYQTAKEMLRQAREVGITNDQVIFDPGIGPIGSDMEGMLKRVLETVKRIHQDPDFKGVHMSVGLSNFTHMLPPKRADGSPVRSPLESAFLTLAMPHGLDMVIGSVKRKYEVLKPDHPAMKCLEDALKLEDIAVVERVQEFYS